MDGGTDLAYLHRFSVQDYHRMGELGVFEHARVELVRGAVIDMAPIGTPHLWTVTYLNSLFAPLMVERRAHVSVQNSVRLDQRSEPEPDVVLLRWQADRTVHPGPRDVLLVIEVSDSSLTYDRLVKAPLYAEAGLTEYWIVDLAARAIEVHREPRDGTYQSVETVASGLLALAALPGFEIAVEQVFGP